MTHTDNVPGALEVVSQWGGCPQRSAPMYTNCKAGYMGEYSKNIYSILTTDAKIHHFIYATEANKMADLTAIVSFGQNQKLQTFKRKFLPSLGINLNNFVIIRT